jgi:hypothetical protein
MHKAWLITTEIPHVNYNLSLWWIIDNMRSHPTTSAINILISHSLTALSALVALFVVSGLSELFKRAYGPRLAADGGLASFEVFDGCMCDHDGVSQQENSEYVLRRSAC